MGSNNEPEVRRAVLTSGLPVLNYGTGLVLHLWTALEYFKAFRDRITRNFDYITKAL